MTCWYTHVNVVCKDWRSLADFYIEVFGCTEKPPERDIRGPWLDDLTGLSQAHIRGVHLVVPGYGDHGPTLELFTYDEAQKGQLSAINRVGFAHIAFAVDDVHKYLQSVLDHGGSLVGKAVEADIASAGRISVAYVRDPEGNIIELQKWSE
jgi:predicted enzyme related to lactoylglutathione lyase